MNLIPLSTVAGQLQAGTPLPWNVRDETGKLLLARGQLLLTKDFLERLRIRGVYVDIDEVNQKVAGAPGVVAVGFFDQLKRMEARLSILLKDPSCSDFPAKIHELASTLARMAAQQPDALIHSIVCPRQEPRAGYGVLHALHAAAVCGLLVHKFNWTPDEQISLLQAALTMNLSITELQNQLALRGSRLTEPLQAEIHRHPLLSVKLLQQAGVTNALWLKIVGEHHEQPEGAGYPNKIPGPHELSQVLHLVDVFLAKHSPRAGRTPIPAKQAAQELYQQTKGHAVASALIKEFGVYPPGCFVKLANGETAVAVTRGTNAGTPFVASLVTRSGCPLVPPVQRDTSRLAYAIVGSSPESLTHVSFSSEALYKKAESFF